jgi:hypothetical protein
MMGRAGLEPVTLGLKVDASLSYGLALAGQITRLRQIRWLVLACSRVDLLTFC